MKARQTAAAVGLPIAGIVAAWHATRWGIGVSTDSAVYLIAAESLRKGAGLSDGVNPLVHFPPLFSILTAAVTFVCPGLRTAARILNIGLFAASTFLIVYLGSLQRPSDWFRPALAGLLFIACVDQMEIHAMAWSEPTFLFLLLAGFALLVRHINAPNHALLAGSMIVLSLAPLARYVGITAIPAACVVLLLYRGFREALVFGVAGIVPLLLWLLRNLALGGQPTTGRIMFHPYSLADLNETLYFISTWLVPHSVPGLVKQIALTVFVFCFLAILMGLRKKRPLPLTTLLLVFLATYATFLVLVKTFVYANLTLDSRMLTPLLACIILFFVLESPGRPVLAVVGILLAGSFILRTGMWIEMAYREGLGYTGPRWSLAEKQIESAHLTDPVFTNLAQPVFRLLFSRTSMGLPMRYDPHTLKPNPAFEQQRQTMQESNGFLVLFDSENYNDALPRELDLKRSMKLAPILRNTEIAVFRIQPIPPP